jgi:phenylalanyl-tRNA synthetase beta subunit
LTDEVHPNSKVSLFAQLHGSLDLLLKKCNLKFEKDYKFESSKHDEYFKGQQFDLLVKGEQIGSIGVLHPFILSKYSWFNPVVVW